MDNPYFSVIVTCYNKAPFIRRALDSIFEQTYHHYEIICVDDGSSDGSLDIIKTYESSNLLIVDQENLGVSVARNNAVARSSGYLLAFLDADDYWSKTHLADFAKLHTAYPHSGILANSYIKVFDNKENSVKLPLRSYDYSVVRNYRLARALGWGIHTSSCAVKRSNFDRAGGFPILLYLPSSSEYLMVDMNGLILRRIPALEPPIKSYLLRESSLTFLTYLNVFFRDQSVQVVLPGPFAEDQYLFDTIVSSSALAYSNRRTSFWSGDIPFQHTSCVGHALVFPMLMTPRTFSEYIIVSKIHQLFTNAVLIEPILRLIYVLKIFVFLLKVISIRSPNTIHLRQFIKVHSLPIACYYITLKPKMFLPLIRMLLGIYKIYAYSIVYLFPSTLFYK